MSNGLLEVLIALPEKGGQNPKVAVMVIVGLLAVLGDYFAELWQDMNRRAEVLAKKHRIPAAAWTSG